MDDQVQDFTITLAMAHLRGAQLEQERIVKLLEASCGQQPDCNCEIVISHAIALIKGEGEK